jgi:hypothetical protein
MTEKFIIANKSVTKVSPSTALNKAMLPAFCTELCDLPHGLGEIQAYIFGRQKYPSTATSSFAAITALQTFASAFVTVQSYSGLGLNEYFLIAAPTGFGKEDLRQSIRALFAKAETMATSNNLSFLSAPKIQHQAPASQQALHKLLEADPAHLLLADEFAEWLTTAKSNSHTQATIGYLMECYTSALGKVIVPQSIAGQYAPVENPRVSLIATTTGERLSEALTQSHADSGTYNRMMIFIAEQDRLQKRYEGLNYEPTDKALEPFGYVMSQTGSLRFDKQAWDFFKQHDNDVIEPLKFADHGLAGRLSEQAIKLAATIALSDKRMDIRADDLKTAYAIRENLYHRAKAFLDSFGSLDDSHETVKALNQLREVFTRHPVLSCSRLSDYSRAFRKLSNRDQNDVINTLANEGSIRFDDASKGRLVSLLMEISF